MKKLLINSGKELIDVIKKYGTVMVSPKSEDGNFITSHIITGIHIVTEYSCAFNTLRYDIDGKTWNYGIRLIPSEFTEHVVYIPDHGKRFEVLPCCLLGKLENAIIYSTDLNQKLSSNFFSAYPSLMAINYSSIVFMVEVDTEE